jgi:hypothetical protein
LDSLFIASYGMQGYGTGILTRLHTEIQKVEVKAILQLTISWTVSQSVLVSGHHLGQKKNCLALSPQVNYADQMATASRRS